ncbi:kinetoplast-associated protein [Histomonas meleagridis]|uniref:kinetoplast-associated protein n=1 Tax=Histomonas meleagridis TaxID=135588 RepID=UPI00355A0D54|nr:kinetoplast-associated protein [Histomonas meleagridis]KAH0796731.1 kinetoplast-associated protein [Histomonas meleagridis]
MDDEDLSLGEMNIEAQNLLKQKEEELLHHKEVIKQAENIISKLMTIISQKKAEIKNLELSNDEDFAQKEEEEIYRIQAEHQALIKELKSKHEKEIYKLNSEFQKSIAETRRWSEMHSAIVIQEKLDELEKYKSETIQAQNQLTNVKSQYSSSNINKDFDKEQNKLSKKIIQLEDQISEITTITRNELRESRLKIKECLNSVEIRRKSQNEEIIRLDQEIEERKRMYETHLSSLKKQYKVEKETLLQFIATSNSRANYAEKMIKDNEIRHETQIEEVLSDIQTLKKSTSSSSTRRSSKVRESIREVQRLEEEKRALEMDNKMLDEEIMQIDKENEELQKEVKRLRAAKQKL